MKQLLAWLACCVAFASSAAAQDLSNYLGPGILTHGAGDIGNRSGEQVDLRYFIDLNAIYDNGIQPVSVDSKGNLVQVGGLYGVDLMAGAYGSHSWRTSLLGLDYRGDFRHYDAGQYYDGSNQHLTIGFTYQKTRRLFFNLQGVAGTYSNFLGSVPGQTNVLPNTIDQPTLLLFDNRTDFAQGTVGASYMLSARASLQLEGSGFYVNRQSSALIGLDGYSARARFQYRLSRVTTIGGAYTRSHYEFPNFFGNSDLDNYSLSFATQIGRSWTFSLDGGAYRVNVLGLQTVALDPAIAALLGVSSTVHTFQSINWIPSGNATLTHKFKTASLNFTYARSAVPGNGVYLTSRSETGSARYSYTGIQKISFSVSGGYGSLATLGQGIPPYNTYLAAASMTYNLTHAINLVGGYSLRKQDISLAGYNRNSYQATVGIAFSPGTLPLSLW